MRTEHLVPAGPHAGLLDWLAAHDIDYQLDEHDETYTARETAAIEHVDPHMFAKTVLVTGDDDAPALAVVPASDLVDLERAAGLLGRDRVRLLSEDEMTALAPDCEVGTIPPIGSLLGVPVIADHGIHEVPEIVFHAGSHRFCVRVDRAQWERAAHVAYGRISIRPQEPPPWSRS